MRVDPPQSRPMYNHGHTDAWWQWRGMKRKGQDGQRLELGGFVALLRREKLPVPAASQALVRHGRFQSTPSQSAR